MTRRRCHRMIMFTLEVTNRRALFQTKVQRCRVHILYDTIGLEVPDSRQEADTHTNQEQEAVAEGRIQLGCYIEAHRCHHVKKKQRPQTLDLLTRLYITTGWMKPPTIQPIARTRSDDHKRQQRTSTGSATAPGSLRLQCNRRFHRRPPCYPFDATIDYLNFSLCLRVLRDPWKSNVESIAPAVPTPPHQYDDSVALAESAIADQRPTSAAGSATGTITSSPCTAKIRPSSLTHFRHQMNTYGFVVGGAS